MDPDTARTRRLLDEIFGDALPATTADERHDPGDRDDRDRRDGGVSRADADLLDQRPPHHDRD